MFYNKEIKMGQKSSSKNISEILESTHKNIKQITGGETGKGSEEHKEALEIAYNNGHSEEQTLVESHHQCLDESRGYSS